MSYNPPFEINNRIISLVADISELAGKATASSQLDKNPQLRRKNRIKTIHGSLAIENNTLTVEQVTAVLNGKTVLAPPKDIEEVKNAFEIYELLDTLNPCSEADLLKAHSVLMRKLVYGAGEYRTKPVGVINSNTGEILHLGALPAVVPQLMTDLLSWLEESDVHPLMKACVFHYEFEVIHPFLDGNGRLGRLWHTLILSKWNPIFAYIPIESIIYENQSEYYSVINKCNEKANSTEFIVLMLELIKKALSDIDLTCSNGTSRGQVDKLLEFCKIPRSRREMQEFVGIEGRKAFNNNFLNPLLEQGKLQMTIPDKPNSRNQKYISL